MTNHVAVMVHPLQKRSLRLQSVRPPFASPRRATSHHICEGWNAFCSATEPAKWPMCRCHVTQNGQASHSRQDAACCRVLQICCQHGGEPRSAIARHAPGSVRPSPPISPGGLEAFQHWATSALQSLAHLTAASVLQLHRSLSRPQGLPLMLLPLGLVGTTTFCAGS